MQPGELKLEELSVQVFAQTPFASSRSNESSELPSALLSPKMFSEASAKIPILLFRSDGVVAGDVAFAADEKETHALIAAQIVVDEAVLVALSITVTPSADWRATTLSRNSLSVEMVAAMV
jgi:hypothetical protein